MKHLRTFESFSINEELFGLPSLSEIKAKAKAWLESNKNNPELQKAIAKAKMEMEKLSPETQDKLRQLSTEKPEEIKDEVEQALKESMINESVDMKNVLSKVLKFFGITTAGTGFAITFASILTMVVSGTGYTKILGIESGTLGGIGMGIMLASIIPYVLYLILKPETK